MMDINTAGLEELIFTFFKMIAELDLKTIDLDFIATFLTFFAPIWNPIWAAVNEWLYANFGF